MNFWSTIPALFRKGTPSFAVLETAILCEVERQLDAEQARRFRDRIDRINLVQRLDGGREINAYEVDGERPIFTESGKILDHAGEKRLSNFSFTDKRFGPYKGAVWIVDGYLFSIEFDGITEHILESLPNDLKVSLNI